MIDDGSTDNTAELLSRWREEADFQITYRFQDNSGKHIAINRGLELANGELFLIIDSDDAFEPESIEIMTSAWNEVENKDAYTGLVTLSRSSNGTVDGNSFPTSPLDTNALDLDHCMHSHGERWGFHRTELLRRFHFPEDAEVRFVPENIVWYAIARHYRIRCINEPLRIYMHDSNNQITRSSLNIRAAVFPYYYILYFSYFDYFTRNPKYMMKVAILYWRYLFHMRRPDRVATVRHLCGHLAPVEYERSISAHLLFNLAALAGFSIYLLDLAKGRHTQV